MDSAHDYSFDIAIVGAAINKNFSVAYKTYYEFMENNFIHNHKINRSNTIRINKRLIKLRIGNHFTIETLDNCDFCKIGFGVTDEPKTTYGILLLYDITNKQSFINIKYWFNKYNKIYDTRHIYFFLIGTKLHLKNKRKVLYKDVKYFADTNNINFIEVSSKTNNHSFKALKLIAKCFMITIANREEKLITGYLRQYMIKNKKYIPNDMVYLCCEWYCGAKRNFISKTLENGYDKYNANNIINESDQSNNLWNGVVSVISSAILIAAINKIWQNL